MDASPAGELAVGLLLDRSNGGRYVVGREVLESFDTACEEVLREIFEDVGRYP